MDWLDEIKARISREQQTRHAWFHGWTEDEVRLVAEVERLRGELAAVARGIADADLQEVISFARQAQEPSVLDKAYLRVRRTDALLHEAAVAAAERRGAEQMREAARGLVNDLWNNYADSYSEWAAAGQAAVTEYSDAIATLPLPGDE